MYSDDQYNVGFDEQETVDDDGYANESYDDYSNGRKSKKWIWWIIGIIVLIIILIIVVTNFGSNDVKIPSIEIIGDERYLMISETVDLDVNLVNNDNIDVIWNSNDSSIADVDNNGVVKGLSLGKTQITATYRHSNNVEYSDDTIINVYQGELGVDLQSITLDETIRVRLNETKQLSINFNPSNAYVDRITYQMTDVSVASITNAGLITGNRVGETNLEVTVNGTYTDTIRVIVYTGSDTGGNDDDNDNNLVTEPTSLTFASDSIEIMVNEEKFLEYTVLPATAKNYKVSFKNSNNTVLTINNNGKMKGFSIGQTTITVTINDKIEKTINVLVKPYIVYVNNLNITSSKDLNLEVGDINQIVYNVTPQYASNKTVTFESTNTSVATVDTNGLINAVGKGTCVITVKTVDGNKTDTININVN